jgi:hypothetical protein
MVRTAKAATNVVSVRQFVSSAIGNPSVRIKPSLVEALTDYEEQLVLQKWKETPRGSRLGLLKLLAFGGSSATLAIFTNALLMDASGQTLNSREYGEQIGIIYHIGVLARRFPAAWNLLQQMSFPDYWGDKKLWQSDDPFNPRYLTAQAIQAIGIVDTEESRQLINSLHLGVYDLETTSYLDGSIITAAANNALLRKYGAEQFFDTIWKTREGTELIDRWLDSEEGERWNQISQTVNARLRAEKAAKATSKTP